MKIGVVGATGMVGETFNEILGKRKFPLTLLRPFASDKSIGNKILCSEREWTVESLHPGCFKGLDIVFFSSGDDISKEWAPRAVADGAYAIDNSAAFRSNEKYPLVVPEINGDLVSQLHAPTIIANPNCSTIQLVVVLHALRAFGLQNVHVATYQSVSGAGKAGSSELLQQTKEFVSTGKINSAPATFPHEIAFNCIPQIGSFNDDGYCGEEIKIMNETRKILQMPKLKVSAFTVRVPSLNSHSEAAWVTFDQVVSKKEILGALKDGNGLQLMEHTTPNNYPTTRMAAGSDPVYVGRVHQDLADPKTWLMWIVADNILKGAALNGIQIAEILLQKQFHSSVTK